MLPCSTTCTCTHYYPTCLYVFVRRIIVTNYTCVPVVTDNAEPSGNVRATADKMLLRRQTRDTVTTAVNRDVRDDDHDGARRRRAEASAVVEAALEAGVMDGDAILRMVDEAIGVLPGAAQKEGSGPGGANDASVGNRGGASRVSSSESCLWM